MASIHNTVVNAGEVPLRELEVTVSLSFDPDGVLPTVPSVDKMIHRQYVAETDGDGYWELDVYSNDDIDPSGTLYKIEEANSTYYVDVPSGATPVYWVGDILAAKPSWES
jgi:hypothetical protein